MKKEVEVGFFEGLGMLLCAAVFVAVVVKSILIVISVWSYDDDQKKTLDRIHALEYKDDGNVAVMTWPRVVNTSGAPLKKNIRLQSSLNDGVQFHDDVNFDCYAKPGDECTTANVHDFASGKTWRAVVR